MRLFIVALLFLSMCGCQIQQIASDLGNSYLIKEGNHYPVVGPQGVKTPRIGLPFFGKVDTLYFRFAFKEGSWYTPPDERDDWNDLNKLVGVGLGGIFPWTHHEHSVRIAWLPDWENPDLKQFNLYVYIYDDGNMRYYPLGKGIMNYASNGYMVITPSSVDVVLYPNSGARKSVKVDGTFPTGGGGTFLAPYFGGDMTAPHDMYIGAAIARKKLYTYIVQRKERK